MKDFENLFSDEIRDKKKKVQSYRQKTKRGGGSAYRKRGILPTDRMSKKELREYTKAGKVVTSNVYEKILPKDQFDSQPETIQRAMFIKWRDLYTNEEIMDGLGINNNVSFYNLIKKLNIPPKRRGGSKKRNKSNKKNNKLNKVGLEIEQNSKEEVIVPSGFSLNYNGDYTSEQLENIFKKLSVIVSNETNKYSLSLNLIEVQHEPESPEENENTDLIDNELSENSLEKESEESED